MSRAGDYLIVRGKALGVRLVKRTSSERGRVCGTDLETGAAWTGKAGDVLATHFDPVSAGAALSRSRARAKILAEELDKAARALRKKRRQAEYQLQQEAGHGL